MSFAEHNVDRAVELAAERLARGDNHGAVVLLKQALSLDPDHAYAHALLAVALVGLKRLHAAEAEARMALTLDAELGAAYRALGAALLAARRWDEAETHLRHALELDPLDVSAHRLLASLYSLAERRDEALELLRRARELEPNSAGVLADLGDLHLDRGEVMLAERFAKEALATAAEHPEALTVMGHVLLRRGDTEGAREHAIWVLRNHPDDLGALHLLAGVKARENAFLGVWWRWNTWMRDLGDGKSILVLLAAFAIYRAAKILLAGTPAEGAVPYVEMFWYATVIYTWVAPGIYRRMLDKELEAVRLRPDF